MELEAQDLIDELQANVAQLTMENIHLRALIKSMTKDKERGESPAEEE